MSQFNLIAQFESKIHLTYAEVYCIILIIQSTGGIACLHTLHQTGGGKKLPH